MDHKDKEEKITKKLRPRNFPMWLLTDLFTVASMGEDKYGTYDYLEQDYTINDHLDAAKRHLIRYEDPTENDNDHESKVSHLYSVAWRCLVAAHVQKTRPDLDDRYKPKQLNNQSIIVPAGFTVNRGEDGNLYVEKDND